MRRFILSLVVACYPVVSFAATTGEEDTIVINPINATDFEVIEDMNSGPGYFWCGAATFIERRSGRSGLTKLFIKRPRGPSVTASGRTGVVFSTSDVGLTAPDGDTFFITVDRAGATMKSVQARRYCRDAFTRATK